MPDTPPADKATVTVHVTMFEHPIEVPADEVPVLRAQGLLREEPEPPAAPPAARPAASAKSAT